MGELANDDIANYFELLSNSGRWGDDDELGTLNYIMAAERLSAIRLITDGTVVGCQRLIGAAPSPLPDQALRLMVSSGESAPDRGAGFASEYLGVSFHGPAVTHIDSLGHVFWNGRGYNRMSARAVTSRRGATAGSIEVLRGSGILCRGVLLDVPRSQGRLGLEPGESIGLPQLVACADAQEVGVASGDALFVRTGSDATNSRAEEKSAGLDGRCLPWLHDRQVSILGSDGTNDVIPSGYSSVDYPVHTVGIVAMGLWLIDNLALEDLAAACAQRQRWEFCLVIAPLALEGVTGSPINPLAIF